jgi:hypothetical protein
LKCTFRRSVSEELYQVWLEVVELVSTIRLTNDEDEMVWLFNSSVVYCSQSLYKVINFRGIKTVHVPALWRIKIPPRVHFFLWQLINNKVLTRDNLAKRRKVEDPSCLSAQNLSRCSICFSTVWLLPSVGRSSLTLLALQSALI